MRSRWLYIFLPVLIFSALGLYILPDFEISYDDIYENQMVEDNIHLLNDYLHGVPIENPYENIRNNLEFYGTFFNLASYLVQQFFLPDAPLISFERMEIKRYVVFFFFQLGNIALALGIYGFTRMRCSVWLAFSITALMPLYYFYAFSNPKDIPLAVMMTIASVMSGYLTVRLVENTTPPLPRSDIFQIITLGVLIGLCASIRVVGGITLLFWLISWIICASLNGSIPWKNIGQAALIAGSSAFFTLYILHPVAYTAPIGWIWDTLNYHSHHPYRGLTLTDGEWIRSNETPWYFLPKWFLVKIPIVWQILAIAGAGYAACQFRRLDTRARALAIIFTLQLLFLPIIAIAEKANIYGDGRHFLFIYPPLAFFCAIALKQILESARRYAYPAIALTVFLSGKIAWDMHQLHPLTANYFVEPVRGKLSNWSYISESREIIRWLNTNTQAKKVFANTPLVKIHKYVNLYSSHHLQVYNIRRKRLIKRPYYVLDFDYNTRMITTDTKDCTLLYSVTRLLGPYTLTLSSVKYCP